MLIPRLHVLAALLAAAHAAPFEGVRRCSKRDLSSDTYDYVIIGGGASGLTVANRLTEDSAVKVLVIEAGELDAGEDIVTIPALAGGAIGTKYDYNLTYAPNPSLQDRAVSIPQGKIVGGSTKLNRMVFDRGSISDFDRWAELGNPGWDYAGLQPYFLKQETFTAPSEEIVAKWGVQVDEAAHGDAGPIEVGYSKFFWPLTRNIIDATNELGISISVDQANGSPIGGYFCPHNLDPVNATRYSAREAYYNKVAGRANLELITGHQVTKLIIDGASGTAVVTGVEFATSADAARSTVSVSKEAIMAAGSLHTPQILQVSGIGASSLHTEIGVKTVVDLPAVGENLQDHVLLPTVATVTTEEVVSTDLESNATFAAEAMALYKQTPAVGPYTTPTGDFILFMPYVNYTDATVPSSSGTTHLPTDTPAEVVTGYELQQTVLNDRLSRTDSAVLEVIWDTGTLVLGLQHPFSRGSVRAASDSTFDAPVASAGIMSDPADVTILVEAVKYSRTIRNTEAIQSLAPVEVLPGANITSDADIETFIRANAGTLYHPAGSCKMGPREEGGVVDVDLKVYGTSNLRIVDASIMPLLPAQHLMTAVFGVAEKAADIIKGV